jgi:pyridinium-3,5-bisthiocarboxylic acid mononucleotide nickel chelatase
MAQKIAYLDCHAGISGEMFLAALIDSGLSSDALILPLAALPVEGWSINTGTFVDKGVRGTSFQTGRNEQKQRSRRLSEIMTLLQASSLSTQVQENSLAMFRCLATAEAYVQGIKLEKVRFGGADILHMLISFVGAALGIEALGITQLYASPLPLTGGHTEVAHDMIPTPVTLEILRRVAAPWRSCTVSEELVTPIGAAILATLARFETPPMVIEQVGYGFGTKQLPWPDCVRLCLGQLQGAVNTASAEADTDWVTVIESHIDNMSGELLGGLMERLFGAGALDVSYTSIQMKKNRPATLVTIISSLEQSDALAMILLRETSTLGVRIQQMQRLKAQRSQQRIETVLGSMLVKVKRLGERVISVSPEYEECQRVAKQHALPLTEVYEVARDAARSLII